MNNNESNVTWDKNNISNNNNSINEEKNNNINKNDLMKTIKTEINKVLSIKVDETSSKKPHWPEIQKWLSKYCCIHVAPWPFFLKSFF